MKNTPDLEDEPGDRVDSGVAEARNEVGGGEGVVGTSIPGAGIDLDHVMSIESPERPRAQSTAPEEEDRGDEMGGQDSSLTNLRGGAGSESPHGPPRPPPLRMGYNTQHPLPGQNGYYPESMSHSQSQPSSTTNTYSHYDHMQGRLDPRAQAQQTLYDYPLATYDPLNPPYTDSNASSSPTYHARLSSLPWDYHYNNQQHQQHQHQPPQPARPHTNPENQIPPHHIYTTPTTFIDQSVHGHSHTHIPNVPGPSQHHHLHPHPQSHPHAQQYQHQHQSFPLARDPHSPHQYAYSDPQHLPSGSNGNDGPRYSYDGVGSDGIGGQAGSSGGGGNRHGHGQRRTSLDSGQTGKKPITTSRLGLDPIAKQERRREQNRVAQRAFRARAKIREQERSDDLDDDNQNEDVFDAR